MNKSKELILATELFLKLPLKEQLIAWDYMENMLLGKTIENKKIRERINESIKKGKTTVE